MESVRRLFLNTTIWYTSAGATFKNDMEFVDDASWKQKKQQVGDDLQVIYCSYLLLPQHYISHSPKGFLFIPRKGDTNMKISPLSLVLLSSSAGAFVLQNPATALTNNQAVDTRSKTLYASTLEDQDVEVAEKVSHEASEDTFAVSANHVVLDGRIVERRECTQDGRYKTNSITPVMYQEEEEEEIEYHDSSHRSTALTDSDIVSSSPEPHDFVNGIKMTTADAAIETISPLQMKGMTKTTESPNIEEKKDDSKTQIPNFQDDVTSGPGGASFAERVANSGVASAAAMATAAVNAAVSMKTLTAPDVSKSYIALSDEVTIDEDGLPLVYDKEAIETYWKKEKGALNKRWGVFVGKAVPFLTRLTTLFIKDGKIDEKYIPELSQQARIDLQDLGPTFIKAGQMMSVRPDVLPQVRIKKFIINTIVHDC